MGEREVVRVGVVGVGGMGAFHARTLAGLNGVEVVAIADPDRARREEVATAIGANHLAEPMELAGAPHLDGVVLAGPDETHADQALLALEAGTFVLCEKPLATSPADARRVVDAEIAHGARRLQVGLMREYDIAHRQLVAALDRTGAPIHLRAIHRNVHPEVRPIERIVRQSLVHDIHTVRFLTGAEFVEVGVYGSGAAGDRFRHVLAVCLLDDGAHAVLEFDDQGFAYEVGVEVTGRDGDVILGQPVRAVERRDGDARIHVGADWFARFGDAYAAQDRAWVESIRAGAATGPTAWDGYVAELVVDALLTSFATGGPVGVDRPDRPDFYADRNAPRDDSPTPPTNTT